MSQVEPGQIWRDNDKRYKGHNNGYSERFVKIQTTDEAYAHCLSSYSKDFIGKVRKVRIAVSRFNPNRQTGYTLLT